MQSTECVSWRLDCNRRSWCNRWSLHASSISWNASSPPHHLHRAVHFTSTFFTDSPRQIVVGMEDFVKSGLNAPPQGPRQGHLEGSRCPMSNHLLTNCKKLGRAEHGFISASLVYRAFHRRVACPDSRNASASFVFWRITANHDVDFTELSSSELCYLIEWCSKPYLSGANIRTTKRKPGIAYRISPSNESVGEHDAAQSCSALSKFREDANIRRYGVLH